MREWFGNRICPITWNLWLCPFSVGCPFVPTNYSLQDMGKVVLLLVGPPQMGETHSSSSTLHFWYSAPCRSSISLNIGDSFTLPKHDLWAVRLSPVSGSAGRPNCQSTAEQRRLVKLGRVMDMEKLVGWTRRETENHKSICVGRQKWHLINSLVEPRAVGWWEKVGMRNSDRYSSGAINPLKDDSSLAEPLNTTPPTHTE